MYQEKILPFNTQVGHIISTLIGDRVDEFSKVAKAAKLLDSHPFDLSTNNLSVKLSRTGGTIHLLANPWHTDPSVRAMMSIARFLIDPRYHSSDNPSYLRIIYAGDFVYFEIGSNAGIFICGGCTKRSGEGGQGRRDLEALFNLLSLVWCVPIERVSVLDKKVADSAREKMLNCF